MPIKKTVTGLDKVMEALGVNGLGSILNLPIIRRWKYKTLTGTSVLCLSLMLWATLDVAAFDDGWSPETKLQIEWYIDKGIEIGTIIMGVGFAWKNRKADPPAQSMNPVGTVGSSGQAKGQ